MELPKFESQISLRMLLAALTFLCLTLAPQPHHAAPRCAEIYQSVKTLGGLQPQAIAPPRQTSWSSGLKHQLERLRQLPRNLMEYAQGFNHFHTLQDVYHSAIRSGVLDSQISFQHFKSSVESDPLNNFFPLVQRLDYDQTFSGNRANLQKLIDQQVAAITPFGKPIPEVDVVQDLRQSPCRINCIQERLPITTRTTYSGEPLQFFKKIHSLRILDKNYEVPEYLILKESLSRALNMDEAGSLLAKELVRLGASSPEVARSTAFVFLDINNLGHVNYFKGGHESGDIYLKQVTHKIATQMRDSDFIFRPGGDELVIIMFNVTPDGAHRRLQKISDDIFHSKESNAVFRDEAVALNSIKERVSKARNERDIIEPLLEHWGLREGALTEITHLLEANPKPSSSSVLRRARHIAVNQINASLSKIEGMRAGVSIGFSMLKPGLDYAELKKETSTIANGAKRVYKIAIAKTEADFDHSKYGGRITEFEREQHPYDPNTRPIVPKANLEEPSEQP